MIDAEEATSTHSEGPLDSQPAMSPSDAASSPAPEAARPTSDAARWVAEFGDLLWRFALARTRSRHAAEEVVQDTILAAMQAKGSFRGESSERAWLLGIAAHKIADHFRRARRNAPAVQGSPQADESSMESEFSGRGLWASGPANWGAKADDPTEKAELLRAMQKCMQALPPVLAEAVWMRDILNVPSAEVCKALGLTATNLWTRTHRARAALRLCVERAIGLGEKGEGCEK